MCLTSLEGHNISFSCHINVASVNVVPIQHLTLGSPSTVAAIASLMALLMLMLHTSAWMTALGWQQCQQHLQQK